MIVISHLLVKMLSSCFKNVRMIAKETKSHKKSKLKMLKISLRMIMNLKLKKEDLQLPINHNTIITKSNKTEKVLRIFLSSIMKKNNKNLKKELRFTLNKITMSNNKDQENKLKITLSFIMMRNRKDIESHPHFIHSPIMVMGKNMKEEVNIIKMIMMEMQFLN